MKPIERFLHYITYDTQSDEDSALTPSTPKQKRLGARLAQELQDLGLEHAHLAENGAVYGWLPATAGKEDLPVLALIAHMDTSPDAPGADVRARIVDYRGGDIVLRIERLDFAERSGLAVRSASVNSMSTVFAAKSPPLAGPSVSVKVTLAVLPTPLPERS